MPFKEYQKYTIAIAKGEIKPAANAPKIWFDSIESMSQVLSTRNQELLRIIQEQKPQSLAELAVASGRHAGNLTRTLKRLEKYGIVKLQRQNRYIRPQVCANKFEAIFGQFLPKYYG